MSTIVTARDAKTGETEKKEIENDYVIICDGGCYVDHVQTYASGTTVITIRRQRTKKERAADRKAAVDVKSLGPRTAAERQRILE